MGTDHSTSIPRKTKNLLGKPFGRLKVIGYVGKKSHSGRKTWWLCECFCGKQVEVRSDALTTGHTESCGCLVKEHGVELGKSRRQHGESVFADNTPEYRAWQAMIGRCHNPKNPAYHNYGGRGISVCQRWRDSYEDFLADMGRRPTPQHSIDRHPNNDGHYSPDNCRWATKVEQGRNTRTNRLITFRGETRCVKEWAEVLGIPYLTLYMRLFRLGWDDERALTEQVRSQAGRP